MKTLNIDFKLYQEELNAERRRGYQAGVSDLQGQILSLLDGATAEDLYDGCDILHAALQVIEKRLNRSPAELGIEAAKKDAAKL